MPPSSLGIALDSFSTFGDLLLYLRRRAQLRQRDLAVAVGYSEAQIGRLENNQRTPDPTMVLAQFVPALGIADEPAIVARLLALAEAARTPASGPSAGGADAPAPVPTALGRARSNALDLPQTTTPLIGRAEVVAETLRLLETGCRCITICGPGGVGKTRVALEVVARASSDTEVCVATLAGVPDATMLLPTVAQALGLSPTADADAWLLLTHYLRGRTLLLLLDNMEHLIEGARLLVQLLDIAPQLRLLVTSRERLAIAGEVVLDLLGLAFPITHEVPGVEQYPAIALFVSAAARRSLDFKPSRDDLAAIVAICQLVEGLPLGVELAAAWADVLPCAAIVEELRRSLDMPVAAPRDVPSRHHSLRAAFLHSWKLFTADEQQALQQLAVFRGGFTRAAAAAVLQGEALPLLRALADKSMVRRGRPLATGRFELHELVRQFTVERLREQPTLEAAARARHGHYYAALVAEQYDALKGANQQAALALIDADIDNVRAAWQWALAAPDPEPLCRMEPALMLFYEHRSWFAEGRAALLSAVDRLRGLAAANAELRLPLGRALSHAGWFMWRCSQLEGGRALLREGRALLQEQGDVRGVAEASVFLGSVESSLGHSSLGIQLIGQGVAAYERVGDEWGVVNSLYRQGLQLMLQGDYVQAQQMLFACVPRVRAVRDTLGIISVLDRLGAVSLLLGQYDIAERLLQESLLHSSAASHGRSMSRTLQHLGRVAHARGDYTVALYLYQESLELCDGLGDEPAAAWMLTQMAYTLLALGRTNDAREAVRRARRTARHTHVVPLGLDALAGHAALLHHTGEAERAVELIGLVVHHAASEQFTRDCAARILHVAEAQLTPYTVAAALARGRVAELDAELQPQNDP